ncbi:MAG TPA: hypothetical protein VEA63_16035, partial [Opitutus sp.]|nr:hypothetical protein [Opitutus sp.]
FTIFKKGSKGVSYVCAVKRKFRVPGQTFSDTIGALIAFIEANPMVRASELPAKFLGITANVSATKPAEAATDAGAPETVRPAATQESALSIDERAKISRMQGDLLWLVREGYVTEFIDGRLFAPPPMVEARKKEVEAEEHDPENFPDAPPAEKSAAAATTAPAAEPNVSTTPDAQSETGTPVEALPSDPVTQEASPIPNLPDPVVPAAPEASEASSAGDGTDRTNGTNGTAAAGEEKPTPSQTS